MRHLFIFLTLSCLGFTSIAQVVKSDTRDSIIKETNLKGEQLAAWHSLDSIWTNHIFPSCLSENHLKLSCAGCESVFLTVQLKIDSAGKLISASRIAGKMCGTEMSLKMEKCMLDFFYFIEFPKGLRNIILEVKLGNGLKC